jgi:hypothetical protein
MKILPLLFLVLLVTAFHLSSEHRCIHDEVSQHFELIDEEFPQAQDRLLQSQTERPIRIHIDSSNMVGATDEQREVILEKIIPVSINFFTQRLKVLSSDSKLKFASTLCNKV